MNKLQIFQKNNGLEPDGVIGKFTLTMFKQCFNISTDEEVSHFAAQISHETGNFKYEEENLNYSAEGLMNTFGKYFPTKELAEQYARQPEKIANRVYANRMGNGDEASGEGAKFFARGAIQLTGKNNYEIFANKMADLSIMNNPNKVITDYFFESAIFFFNQNGLWKYCKKVNDDSILKLSRAINVGNPNSSVIPNGLQHRKDLTYKFYNTLK